MQLEQEVVLLQRAEHAGKAAGEAVHPAERRHADLTRLMATEQERKWREPLSQYQTHTKSLSTRQVLDSQHDKCYTKPTFVYVPHIVHQQHWAVGHHGKVGGVQVW